MPVAARLTVPVKLFDEVTVTTYVTVLPAVTVCCAGETLIENVPVPPVVLVNPVLQPFETARTTPMARNRTTGGTGTFSISVSTQRSEFCFQGELQVLGCQRKVALVS